MKYTKAITKLLLNTIMLITQAFWEKLKINPTEVSITYNDFSQNNQGGIYQFLYEYLMDLEPPALHNIRLHFHDDKLYKAVESTYLKTKLDEIQYIPENRSYMLHPRFPGESDWDIKIILTTRKLVQVMIKNTFKPITCDEKGIRELISKVEKIRQELTKHSNKILPVSKWHFVRADFGRDCRKPLNRLFPTMEFKDFTGALIRLYPKLWTNGTRRLRLEKIIKPNKTLQVMLEELLEV